MITSYFSEFAALAGMHLLAVASPGPDFALVLRQSIAFGRPTAVATSLGIGSGILVHTAYSVLGLGLVLLGSPRAFWAMRIAGALYLIWMGVQALRSSRRRPVDVSTTRLEPTPSNSTPTRAGAFLAGFLTNAMNVKATIFFVVLYSAVVRAETPKVIQGLYGLWMAVATALWFTLVSLFFTQPRLRSAFERQGHWLERATGGVLIGFGLWLVLEKVSL